MLYRTVLVKTSQFLRLMKGQEGIPSRSITADLDLFRIWQPEVYNVKSYVFKAATNLMPHASSLRTPHDTQLFENTCLAFCPY